MKTVLNILIGIMIVIIMSDCEINAGKTVANYQNSIFALAGFVITGFLRMYFRDFMEFLTKPQ